MSNRNYNTQTNPNRQKLMNGGRAKKNMGGSMNARADMRSGYYPSDMGMEGGAMYKKGGSVKKPIPAGKKGKRHKSFKKESTTSRKTNGLQKRNESKIMLKKLIEKIFGKRCACTNTIYVSAFKYSY